VGARDALALGDCAMMHGNRLPATAQARARPCSAAVLGSCTAACL